MDSHPSCRRPHKLPAHTVKEPGSRPQRLPPQPDVSVEVSRTFWQLVSASSTPRDEIFSSRPSARPKSVTAGEPPIIGPFRRTATPQSRRRAAFLRTRTAASEEGTAARGANCARMRWAWEEAEYEKFMRRTGSREARQTNKARRSGLVRSKQAGGRPPCPVLRRGGPSSVS